MGWLRDVARFARHRVGSWRELEEGFRFWVTTRVGRRYVRGVEPFPEGHEPFVQSFLAEVLGPGMTVVDWGAHYGFFSCLSARLVGSSGRVVAVEPEWANRWVLERNVNGNRLADRVVVCSGALSEDVALATFPGDVLKVDVEGAEYSAIRAAPGSFWRNVKAMVVEVHPLKGSDRLAAMDQLQRFIEDLGFRVGRVDAEGEIRTLLCRRRVDV